LSTVPPTYLLAATSATSGITPPLANESLTFEVNEPIFPPLFIKDLTSASAVSKVLLESIPVPLKELYMLAPASLALPVAVIELLVALLKAESSAPVFKRSSALTSFPAATAVR
jgi:hypothetical protein